MLLFLNTNSKK